MARKKTAASNARAQKELRTLGQKLDALVTRARRTEREAEARYARQLKALRARQAQAKLRRRSAAATPPLKSGLQRAWSDLNKAVRQAATRFRSTS
jgi:hypothetical protein